ncbi:hypothetical protein [Floccifex sp.]|uniref:hypothetical protein n=1 Tax=Floccifex sp. TaxID=2815810 RepID=UPI003F11D772
MIQLNFITPNEDKKGIETFVGFENIIQTYTDTLSNLAIKYKNPVYHSLCIEFLKNIQNAKWPNSIFKQNLTKL